MRNASNASTVNPGVPLRERSEWANDDSGNVSRNNRIISSDTLASTLLLDKDRSTSFTKAGAGAVL